MPTAIRILFIIQIALIAAVLCSLAAVIVFYIVALALGSSDMNGGLAIGSFMTVGPISAIVGFGLGGYGALRISRNIPTRSLTGVVLSLLALAIVVPAGSYLAEELTDGDEYDLDQIRPIVHMEIRLPEMIPDGSADRLFRKSLRSYSSNWVHWENPRQRNEDGRTILLAKSYLVWRVPDRKLELWRADEKIRMVFDLKLPRDPVANDEFSPWQPVEALWNPDTGQSEPALPDPGLHVRWRISME